MLAHLIRIDATDAAGSALPLLLASVDDARCCHLDGEQWEPSIAQLPRLQYDFFGGDFRGSIGRPTTSFQVATGDIAGFADRRFAAARMRLWSGELGAPFTEYALRFDGKVSAEPQVDQGIASFDAAVDDAWLDKPLLALFTGDGGEEGPDDLQGQVKPLLLGACRFASGVLVDAVNLVYRVSAPGSIEAVSAAYDRVVSLGASSGDYADFAALVAADVAAGSWATCLALGLIRLGAPPDGQVSFDVSGDNAGPAGFVRRPGETIGRIAELAGGTFDAGNLAALDTARPWNLSLAVLAQTTARQVIQELADSVCAVAGIGWTGTLFVQPVAIGAASFTLASDGTSDLAVNEVSQLPIGPPFWRLATQAEITWVVHDPASVASQYNYRGRYDADRVYRLDDMVDVVDGSAWVWINATPGSGQATPTWPTASDAYWQNVAPPTAYADGTVLEDLKPAEPDATAGATIGVDVKIDGGSVPPAGAVLNDGMALIPIGELLSLQYTPADGEDPVVLSEVRPPDFGAAKASAVDQASDALERLAAAVVQLQKEAGRAREVMRDAGISVDPATGQVHLHAFDRSEERLNTVDVRLDAAEASIVLRATTTYVDNAIATAVLDPSQVPVFDDLDVRISAAEVDIDGLQAQVSLLATNITVDALTARVTTAETDIDALEGLISTKVDNTTFDALETRVDSAETQLSAMDGASITDTVRAARLLTNAADDQDAFTLSGLLAADRAKRSQVAAIAEARQELTAKIVDAVSAEATQRTALAARVGAAAAAIVNESTTRASQDSAIASQVTSLSTTVAGHTASITEFAGSIDGLEAKVGVRLDVNGRVTGWALNDDGDEGILEIVADTFAIVDPDGGPALTWQEGVLWNRGETTSIIIGQDFGTTGDLLLWAGPNPASAAAASKANSVFWIDSDGLAFFGGISGAVDVATRQIGSGNATAAAFTAMSDVIAVIPSTNSASLIFTSTATITSYGTGLTFTYEVKWQYSADSTTWADIAGGTVGGGSVPGDSGAFFTTTNGNPATATKTGLTAGTPAYFRVVYRVTAGAPSGGQNAQIYGSATADAS